MREPPPDYERSHRGRDQERGEERARNCDAQGREDRGDGEHGLHERRRAPLAPEHRLTRGQLVPTIGIRCDHSLQDDASPGICQGGKSAIVCVRSRLVKICVVGGGSTYTPELVDGILRRRDRLPASELVLLDPNHERLEIVGRFARRMCEASGSDLQVRWTADAADALAGSEFVVTQLRVGGQEARHRDELAGRAFGLIGQETTGIGGFAKALRTIPVMLAIAREVERSAPGATLVNFTNPAGLITELLRRHTSLRVVGSAMCRGTCRSRSRTRSAASSRMSTSTMSGSTTCPGPAASG